MFLVLRPTPDLVVWGRIPYTHNASEHSRKKQPLSIEERPFER